MHTGRKRVFAVIYKILRGMKGLDISPFIGKWEKELGTRVYELETRQLLKRVHSTSVNSNVIELNSKCLAQWYITPDKVHKCQKETSQLCWRGCEEIGTMAHI